MQGQARVSIDASLIRIFVIHCRLIRVPYQAEKKFTHKKTIAASFWDTIDLDTGRVGIFTVRVGSGPIISSFQPMLIPQYVLQLVVIGLRVLIFLVMAPIFFTVESLTCNQVIFYGGSFSCMWGKVKN